MATRCTRKGSSLRTAKRWITEELEIIENLNRRVSPIDTMTSKHKLLVLGEFFPSVAMEVRRDVLAAANYREDVAASMLGDITRDNATATTAVWMKENTELLFADTHAEVNVPSELADEDDWSGISAISNDTDAWVVVPDNWQIVDKESEKARSFADVLQTKPILKAATTVLSLKVQPMLSPRLAIRDYTPANSCKSGLNNTESDKPMEECGIKSFGARKRYLLKLKRQ